MPRMTEEYLKQVEAENLKTQISRPFAVAAIEDLIAEIRALQRDLAEMEDCREQSVLRGNRVIELEREVEKR